MKILMLTPYVPYPPSSGGQIRTYNLLKYLAKENEITLVCLYKNNEEKKYYHKLKHYCRSMYFCRRANKPWQPKNIFKSVFSRLPFLIVRNYSKEAEDKLKELLEKEEFDVIHAETFYIMPHLPETKIPVFLLEQTIEYEVYEHFVKSLPFFVKPFFSLDILKLRYWERYYWKKAYLVGAVSETDRKIIQSQEPEIKTTLVPNGAGDEMILQHFPKKDFYNPTAIFLGNFYWLQNVEAANFLIKKIYPIIKAKIPYLKLIICGQGSKKKIKIINDNNINIVEIKPDENDKVKKMYKEATVFLAPIFGPGGTRLKILAAMASGLAVISTKTGVEGLDLVNKRDVLLAETPEEFVNKLNLLISDKKLFETIRRNAYSLIKNKYNWKAISSELNYVYRKIIENYENRN